MDKLKHFTAGAGLAWLAFFFARDPLLAFAFAALAGAVKEAVDFTGRGHPDWWDFWATAAGGATVFMVYLPRIGGAS